MVQTVELVEAVIISGPRRGEIVCLAADAIPELSEGDLKLLNAALDEASEALDRLEAEVQAAREAFREPAEPRDAGREGHEAKAASSASEELTE